MKSIKYRHRPLPLWQSQILVGLVVALCSQLYLLPMEGGSIRISAAVILFPIFLLALLRDRSVLQTGMITALVVILFRLVMAVFQGGSPADALTSALPGGLYYLCYAALFQLFRWRPQGNSPHVIFTALWLCDLMANLTELLLSYILGITPTPDLSLLASLALVALLRATIAAAVLWWLGYCRRLLLQEEHEERYQRLFLMTAQLKNEVYLLENSTEQIEQIMSGAYQLYEILDRQPQLPQNLSELALSITRDIHEVKKSNLRVLRGLESGLDDIYDQEALSFSDLIHILVESSYHLVTRDQIVLTHQIEQDFPTAQHYPLISILRNLVNNAMEAILTTDQPGHIHIRQQAEGAHFRFTVSDDGPGMTPRAQQNIFQMGYSTKFNPVTGDMNRGVGLCTVKTLVEDLGGEISVQSQLGEGTVFTIVIPRKSLEA